MEGSLVTLGIFVLVCLLVAAIVCPAVLLTPCSNTYLISNPTDQQLQDLHCKKACPSYTEQECGHYSWGFCQADCIQIHAVDFLGTITLGEEKLLKVKVSDRNGGKIEKFIKAVGVEYIKWGD